MCLGNKKMLRLVYCKILKLYVSFICKTRYNTYKNNTFLALVLLYFNHNHFISLKNYAVKIRFHSKIFSSIR